MLKPRANEKEGLLLAETLPLNQMKLFTHQLHPFEVSVQLSLFQNLISLSSGKVIPVMHILNPIHKRMFTLLPALNLAHYKVIP